MTKTPESAIRVLLVDDHQMVRVGLGHLLSKFASIRIAGYAASIAEAIREAESVQPDVIVLDIRLPDGAGYTACDPIRRKVPAVKFLVLTSYTDDVSIFESIAAGVNGFLLKDADSETLVDAIEQVHEGKSILAPAITDRVLNRIKTDREDSPEKRILLLSRQERRVLALVAEGKTNKEIGAALALSDKTVKNYLSNALDKLGVHRRTEAAAIYGRHITHEMK